VAVRNRYRKGDWLVRDDITGDIVYASETVEDWRGFRVHRKDADERNMQEFVRAYADPYPLPFVRPDNGMPENNECFVEFIGNTNVPSPTNSPASHLFDLGIGEMVIGTSFCVR
jgi:hypothetical protein